MTESKNIFETKEGGEQKSGKTGGEQKSGKTGGEQKSGKTGGEQKSGKTGGEQKSGKNKEEEIKVEQKDKFPINSIELSNLFRDWLNDTQYSYASTNNIDRTITDKKKIAEDSIKNAWAEFGDKYIKWLAGTYDDVLVSIGLDLDKANSEWKKGEGQKISAFLRQKEQQRLEKTKCEPWTSGNLIDGHLNTNDTISLNKLTEKFVEWCKTNGWLDKIVTASDFCGFSKFDISWVYEKWPDISNVEHEPYQNPLVRKLALHETWIEDQNTGIYRKQNLFNKFLVDTKEIEPKDIKTQKISKQERGEVPADLWAQSIMNVGANRYNCTSLRDALKTTFEKTEEIETAIQYCNSKNKNWLDTSLEGRVKSKLKIFKEGRMIQETITNKLKSKKNLKSLKENFEKQNYRKFFDSLSSLQKNNTINEATNDEFEKSFDVIFKGKETEFKNRAIEYILNKLGVSQTSEMGKNIKLELDKIPAKDMFKNEYDVPEAVTTAVEKSANTEMSDEEGLKGIVSKSIKFDDKQIKQGVRQHLQDYIEGVKTDIKSLEEKLKKSIIEK